ncbi:resolvase (plasmid) [Bacillus mycoides]|nr:resolvase [Bacillus mycoides]
MNTRKNGYIRVSRKNQNKDQQLEAMKQLITDERDIFIDKQSGRDFNRDPYQLFQTHKPFEQYQLLS